MEVCWMTAGRQAADLRNIGARMASKPLSVFTEPGRRPHRHWGHRLYGFALFLVVALALVGVVAIALLILGLLDVHAVTRHFSVH
jgi:hypothetical protein